MNLQKLIREEGDEFRWNFKGFDCLIKRNNSGACCGYVILDKDHDYYGINYDDLVIDCHGGLIYSDMNDDDKWLIGFDCSHYMDLVPNIHFTSSGIYRTKQFVIDECEKIVDQIFDKSKSYRLDIKLKNILD